VQIKNLSRFKMNKFLGTDFFQMTELISQPFAAGYPDGRIMTCNKAFCDLLGFSQEELLKLSWQEDLTPPEWRERESKILTELDLHGIPQFHEKEFYSKDGSRVLTELYVHRVSDKKGSTLFYYSFINDITERRKTERKAKENLKTLEERLNLLTNELVNKNMQLELKNDESILLQNMLNHFFDLSSDMFFIINFAGIVKHINSSCERVLGYSKKELLEKNLKEFIHPDDLDISREAKEKSVTTGIPIINFQNRYRCPDDSYKWLEWSAVPQVSAEIIYAVARDVSQRKLMEKKLTKAHDFIWDILESIKDPFYVLDEKLRFIYINQKALDFFQASRKQSIGKRVKDIYPQGLPVKIHDKFQKAFSENKVEDFELFLPTTNKWYHYYLYPTKEKLSVIFRDVTDLKNMEREMMKMDRLNLISQMAAGIGHEIRNPMTTVRGFLQIFKNKESCKKYQEQFELMIEELDRANSIITEYLSLATYKPLKLKRQNLNSIIKTILPLLVSDAIKRNNHINIELNEVPELILDNSEIGQLLINLVRNGLDAMEAGRYLTIRTFVEGTNVVLAVQDQGKGIEPNILDKIGIPFFTTKDNGTGLGLAVCNSIAERHKASIDIDTAPGGTTFYVRFVI